MMSGSIDSIDVFSLTDQQLAQMLRAHGATCGPIIDQTRHVYRRKLTNLLSGNSSMANMNDIITQESESEDDTSMTPAGNPTTHVQPTEQSFNRSSEQVRQRYAATQFTYGVQPEPSTLGREVQSQSSNRSYRLPLVAFTVVMGLVFLVIYNMEPSYSVPGLTSNPSRR